jgi:hypothetical protein
MNKPVWRSLINALLAFAHIVCIGLFFSYVPKQIFGEKPGVLGFAIFLLLFVLSAAVMGILILGKPVLLYLDNKKKESLAMLFYTIGWLAVILFVTIFIVFLLK